MVIFLVSAFGLMIDGLRDSYLFQDFKILTDLCLVPLVGAYLLKVMIPEFINLRRILLLLVPNVIFAVIHTYTRNSVIFTMSVVYTIIVAVLIFVFIVFIADKYNRYLKRIFSNIDNKTVGWVRVVTYVFAAWYIVWALALEIDSRWIDSAYYLFLIVIWLFIYRYSVKHITAVTAQDLFEKGQTEVDKSIQSEVDQAQSEATIDLLGQRLQTYISEYHPWLNHSLTLQELAIALGTNRTYLSDYLNNRLNTTFYDYINGFRIRHACELLLIEPESQLDYIGEQSGFNSLSTFRRAFEKQMGTTPAKFRNQVDI